MLPCGDDDVMSTARVGCRLLLENYRHVLLNFEYHLKISILIYEFELQLPPCYAACLLYQTKDYPPPILQVHPMSLQTLADDHTHVIQLRACIGEVIFADVSRSPCISVAATILTDG